MATLTHIPLLSRAINQHVQFKLTIPRRYWSCKTHLAWLKYSSSLPSHNMNLYRKNLYFPSLIDWLFDLLINWLKELITSSSGSRYSLILILVHARANVLVDSTSSCFYQSGDIFTFESPIYIFPLLICPNEKKQKSIFAKSNI